MFLEEGNLVPYMLGVWGAAPNGGAVGGWAKGSYLEGWGVGWLLQVTKVECKNLHVVVDYLPIVLCITLT